MLQITDLLAAELQHDMDRNGALSPSLQVCLPLQYVATETFQNLGGDSIQAHKSTVCCNKSSRSFVMSAL